jgi:hypothetical protein
MPSSPTQWYAIRSPLPAATCRSRQLCEALSLPSLNHLAQGGFQSSTVSQGSNQSSSLAHFSHQASKSASASS